MNITAAQIRKIATGSVNAANMNSALMALEKYGAKVGLDQPHRLAQYIAQLMHESGSFRWDKEIWGPTAAQKRYEGRRDLGNTKKGDGKKFMGRTAIQITGRGNARKFTAWARKIDPDAPDFEENPELMNTDPWEGLGPIWYWDDGNPDGKSLNRYADSGNIEMITRRINGGLNGYDDRLTFYDRAALVMLDYGPTEIEKFQKAAKARGEYDAPIDGVSGPRTRAALHRALVRHTDKADQSKDVAASPVVEEKKVVPPKVEKEVKQKTNFMTQLFGGGGAIAVVGTWLGDADWQTIGIVAGVGVAAALAVLLGGQWMVRRIKAIRAEVES